MLLKIATCFGRYRKPVLDGVVVAKRSEPAIDTCLFPGTDAAEYETRLAAFKAAFRNPGPIDRAALGRLLAGVWL
jgi:hypothetical protein